MRLIDADKLHKALVDFYGVKDGQLPPEEFLRADSILDAQPTVKQKKGEWTNLIDERGEHKIIMCSVCHEEAYWEAGYGPLLFDFCPYCGADMCGE